MARRDAETKRWRVPVAVALVGGVVVLLAVAIGGVLALSQTAARAITLSLLADNADVGLELVETRIHGQLDPASAVGLRLAALIRDGEVDPSDGAQLEATFQGALAAVPQVTALIFIDAAYNTVQVPPNDDLSEVVSGSAYTAGLQGMLDDYDSVERMVNSARDMQAEFLWMAPVWVQSLNQPVLFLEVPVRGGPTFHGVVLVVVALGDLSAFLKDLEAQGTSAFVLYQDDAVLSHPALFDTMLPVETVENEIPLPGVDMFPADPALQFRATGEPALFDIITEGGMDRAATGAFEIGSYLVVVDELTDFGPWQLGLKLPLQEVREQVDQLRLVLLAGFGILVLAVILGLVLGRAMTRQVGGLAAAADRVAALDLAGAGNVPRSRFRELDNAAQAFNAMTQALQRFETYVPKTLVLRLLRQGADAGQPQERDVTVLFTDIRGFSTMAETMAADALSALLSHHFDTLTACIERHGGTVDKFIGDSVMAFWGAPEDQPDHAARALLAARDIQAAIAADAAAQRAAGETVVGVRVGVHSGPVMVGDIGSQARVNYTVVGDTVNTAARLEAMAKDVAPTDDCVVLVSGETVDAAGDAAGDGGVALQPLGERPVRGRQQMVAVYRVVVA